MTERHASMLDGGSGFRVTFDSSILCRESDLSLRSDPYGKPILKEGMFLMELKCPGAVPMWMAKVLSEEHLYKTSFSKYGTAYCSFMDKAPHERAHEIAAAGYESYAAALAAAAAGRTTNRAHGAGRSGRRPQERTTFFGRASA